MSPACFEKLQLCHTITFVAAIAWHCMFIPAAVFVEREEETRRTLHDQRTPDENMARIGRKLNQ